ncbi:1-phosphofructokinase family hexose kinase [Albidovulum sediminicola]|uniref:Phosphofructokinase n=1 Tax=Albidovulum sediminicola TaxID=2984331 RepID=A0ABT2Z1R9_9RHOB|nr:1-phosphofructokinase family hexose kinase [Defluviimonas sp. WL0075]MCV2865038.1 1-phosphofructokinase family hexose kinase [Defluviimonas sp. WL0075]
MTPIVTLTLNPALDLAVETRRVLPGPKLRCTAPRIDPGGGGVNVSRVVARLGGETLALVAVGGGNGARLCAALATENVPFRPLPSPGETREGLTVTERSTGEQYRFALPGPKWRASDVASALRSTVQAVARGQFLVMSGSLPPGVPADVAARLARRIARAGGRMGADTSGAALAELAGGPSGLDLLRMNGAEAEELAGHPLPLAADSADFAQALVHRGVARLVIVARGAEGSVLASPEGRFLARAAEVPVKSRIGAGDSFMGAMVLALARGLRPERALQEGTAAACAAVMTDATELCRAREARRLIRDCPVQPV